MAEAPIDLEAEDLERAADTEPVEGAIAEAPDNDGGRPATVEEGGGDTNADEAAEAVVPPPNAEPEPSVAAAEEKAPEEAEIGGDGLTTPRKLTKTADPSQVLPTSVVLLNDRYEIFPSKPLPELDSPSASAFEAQDKQQEHGAIFALICLPDIPVRLNEIEQVSGETIAGIIKLLSAGSEEWPILGRWCQILIYERPLGGRVFTALENEPADFKKIDIVRAVSNQVISSILNLTMQGISHRAIRADNIFYKNDSRTEIILGDYLSAPAGFDQPLAYETIERGMALEGGRGMGNSSDDLYAFGVTLAFIVQPVSPIMGKTREQMIMSKIIHTSYQALVGRNILTSALIEPLRGLLQDDPEERWGFEEFDIWGSGKRVPATLTQQRQRSPRPLKFGGYDHMEPRSMAYAMSLRQESAIKMIHDDTIRTWIDRGIENKEMAEIVEETVLKIKTMGPDAKSADDILLACVLLILDPYRPITYKHAVYMPDGFGPALALEVVNNGYVQDLAESILRDIPAVWYEMRPSGGADVTEAKTFQELHEHLANTKIGYGIERCIYQMNTGFACRSPILAGRRVTEIEELLPALSEVEKETNDTSKPPIDRHIAAFILASHTSDIEKLFTNLQDSSEAVAALSVLTLYAKLQQDLGPEELPGLAKWLGGLLAPVIRQFKSRKTRRNLEAEVPRLVRRGQLPALLNLLMDIETRYNDQQDYIAARVEFLSADEEIGRVEKNSDPESETVLHFSRKIAAVTSIVFMIILVTMMIIAA